MDDEIQVVNDGDGLAIFGKPEAVERSLRSLGLWKDSKELDLGRLKGLLGLGGDVSQVASEIAAHSSRWVKLTEASARLYKEHGLMESKVPGESHLMVGIPGHIGSWLQAETGVGSLLTNPAVLSGVGGLMAQVAARQAMAEIATYLVTINHNVNAVLRKQDNAVVASMVGVGAAIDRALTLRDAAKEVDETLWSTVSQSHTTIGATQRYALDELDEIARSLESTKVGDLATYARKAVPEVQKWLGVLAYCFQQHEAVDVLELDRRIDQSPEKLDEYRRGMKDVRDKRRELISQHTERLLARMDKAVGRANEKMVWTRTWSMAVVASGNHVAVEVDQFHDSLQIVAEARSWQSRPLGPGENVGSQVIQKGKDAGPYVGTAATVIAMAAVGVKKYQGGRP